MAEPYCLAMVLADAVHVDATTGKQTILGTFSTVGAQSYPTKLRFCVYFAVTDAHGDFRLTFRIVDSRHVFEDTVQPVLEVNVQLSSPSPLAVCESCIALGGEGVQLPDPGVYHCELLHGESLLMSRRLVAVSHSDIKG